MYPHSIKRLFAPVARYRWVFAGLCCIDLVFVIARLIASDGHESAYPDRLDYASYLVLVWTFVLAYVGFYAVSRICGADCDPGAGRFQHSLYAFARWLGAAFYSVLFPALFVVTGVVVVKTFG